MGKRVRALWGAEGCSCSPGMTQPWLIGKQMLCDAVDTEPGVEYELYSQGPDCRIWDDLQGHHKCKNPLELYTVHPVRSPKRSQPFLRWSGHPQLAKLLAFLPLQPHSSPMRQTLAARCGETGRSPWEAAYQQVTMGCSTSRQCPTSPGPWHHRKAARSYCSLSRLLL